MATVTARTFDGVNDVIRVSPPTYNSGAFTWAGVVKLAATTSYQAMFTLGDSGPDLVIEFRDDGDFEVISGGGGTAQETTLTWATTSTRLIVVTRTAANDPRYHLFDGSTWAHATTNSGGFGGDPTDWTSSEARFGNYNDSFNWFGGDMVMQALNLGTDLSTNGATNAAVEALAGGDRDDYVAAGFDHLWEFDQASTPRASSRPTSSPPPTWWCGSGATGSSARPEALLGVR